MTNLVFITAKRTFVISRGEGPETMEMERGDIYFIRYKIVNKAIKSGQVDLL